MEISMKHYLLDFMEQGGMDTNLVQVPDIKLDAEKIKAVMINEVPPQNPDDYFYSKAELPDYMKTTIGLFKNAGVNVDGINDIINMGIYITTAVKTPKAEYTVKTESIKANLPVLMQELSLFPNLKVIMLMGDVAKKAFNLIAKKKINQNNFLSGSTYKIRANEFYYEGIRVFPSYIMTGGNILIEKSKCTMISEDIRKMMELL